MQIQIISQCMRMKHLDLYNNGIGAIGAQALASGNLTALTSLDLPVNSIGAAGAAALANSNLTALTYINLSKNSIGD
ncbi:hypothetical protein GR268_47200, partial [Rhizobium leguminosarum]|nr:hypothetical protein [Rhizobium leguminosarum]